MKFLQLILFVLLTNTVMAQKYFTRTGEISFFSEAPTENIEAKTNQATCILDTQTGELAFSVQMLGFHFEKALMEEHFNENYVESHKYPKSTFKGKILDFEGLDLNVDAIYSVKVSGEISLHGETKEIVEKGTIEVKSEKILLSSKFYLKVEDFRIKIPKAVINNIAEEIEVSVNAELAEYKK